MKRKISTKLMIYFGTTIFVFALILSVVFIVLFRQAIINDQKQKLIIRAENIASALSTSIEGRMIHSGMRSSLRFLHDSVDEEVWIIDNNYQTLTRGFMHGGTNFFQSLPESAKLLVIQVLSGETSVTEDFSSILEGSSITVGTPLRNNGNEILGAVLVHTSLKNLNAVWYQGVLFLVISVLIGLILVFIISWVLSKHFSKPLQSMIVMANQLALGDTTVRIDESDQDEVGDLMKSLNTLAEQLNEADSQRQQLDLMRKDFIASVSHELRTPVTVLRGSIEALKEKVVYEPEEIDKYYGYMHNQTIILQRLISDLLELTRLDNPDFSMQKVETDVIKILHQCIEEFKIYASTKNIIFECKLTGELIIWADIERIFQLYMILLDNAIKYSPINGLIKISFLQNEKAIIIEDQGPGIIEEDIHHIFQRFYKGKNAQSQGSGLGLSLAFTIAQRHKISLRAKSDGVSGSQFIMSFNEVT